MVSAVHRGGIGGGMRKAADLVRALILLMTAASPALAQITAATISGTIKDQTGAVLPGVDVTVKNVDTGLNRSAVTDGSGTYTIPGLPPGEYETRASLQGFGTIVERVKLTVGQQAGLNLTMKVG